MSKIERQWWFSGPVTGLALIGAFALFRWAGYELPFGEKGGLASWLVLFLCAEGLRRAISMSVWLLLLVIAPAAVRERAS